MHGKLLGTDIMRLVFACLACVLVLLAALFVPFLGVYIAIVLIGFSLVPIGLVEQNFGPAINGFARAHALDGNYLTAGIVTLPILFFGVGCLIKALWDRDAKIAALGIVSLGYLAVTVLAYFQFGRAFHG
jgi:hypothetical protein